MRSVRVASAAHMVRACVADLQEASDAHALLLSAWLPWQNHNDMPLTYSLLAYMVPGCKLGLSAGLRDVKPSRRQEYVPLSSFAAYLYMFVELANK